MAPPVPISPGAPDAEHSPTAQDEVADDVGLLDVEERSVEQIELVGDGHAEAPVHTYRKIGSGLAVLAVLAALPYVVPGLERARGYKPESDPVPFWNLVGRELLGEGEAAQEQQQEVAEAEKLAQELVAREEEEAAAPRPDPPRPVPAPAPELGETLPPYEPHPDDEKEVKLALELPSPDALDDFFGALARTDAGYEGAVTRVSHWGDSVIGNDNVSSALRFEMQRRFGDAGHGFHLAARPNKSYRHRGIAFETDGWRRGYIITGKKEDGHYGLGGTTVWSAGGAEATFGTEPKLAFGRSWSKVELWYAAQPEGGLLRLTLDEEDPVEVSTAAEALEDRWHTLTMPDGEHALTVRASGEGEVRLYGATFERDVPGVVWDGMAQIGAFTSRMLNFDQAHLQRQVDHRDPDLMVFMFGGNDMQLGKRHLEEYARTYAQVLRNFRGEAQRDCLVIAPVDHGERQGDRIVSRKMVPRIVKVQREVAAEVGCAFFDTFAAMGGAGAAGRWRHSNPPLIAGDLAHLNRHGQKVVGHWVYVALMAEYVKYRTRE